MSFGKQNKNNVSNKRFNSTEKLLRKKHDIYDRNKFFLPMSIDDIGGLTPDYNVTPNPNDVAILYRVNRKNNYFGLNLSISNTIINGQQSNGFSIDWGDGTSTSQSTFGNYNIEHEFDWNAIPDSTRFDVTFSTTTNLVNKTSHGLVNGDKISFSEINTTTSLTVDYTYYVINATTNNFQLSKTLNGTAETININGTGFVLPYKQVIIKVNADLRKKGADDIFYYIEHNLSFWSYKPTKFTNTSIVYETGLLEVISSMKVQFNSSYSGTALTVAHPYLEMVGLRDRYNSASSNFMISSTFGNCYSLIHINTYDNDALYISSSFTVGLFYACYKLKQLPEIKISNKTSSGIGLDYAFYQCYSLEVNPKISYPDAQLTITSTSYTFYQCYSLQQYNKIDTKYCIDLSFMFQNCRTLKSINEIDLTSAVAVDGMLSNLYLDSYGNLNVPNTVTLINTPIFSNSQIKKVGNIKINNATSNLAIGITYIEEIGDIYLYKYTTLASLFFNCLRLKKVGKIYAPLATNTSAMFSSCQNLIKIGQITTGSLTNTSNMFSNCWSLKDFPTIDTSNCTNTSFMFQNCYSLESIGTINISKSTDNSSMFAGCNSLNKIENIITNILTNVNYTSMFSGAFSLESIGSINLSKATNTTSMFQNCYSLKNIGNTNATTLLITANTMFQNCYSLDSIGTINLSGVNASPGTMLLNCYNLTNIGIINLKYGHTIGPAKLEREDLETYFNNLGSGIASPGTFTITNCLGATGVNAVFSKTGSVGAIGATTITNSNTSNIQVGSHLIVGPTLTRTVNLTTSTNTITINNHGIPNGKMVSMTTTAGGLTGNVPYYVVNSTTNTFGLATTLNGTAITFTGTTNLTMRLYHKVTAVNTNVSYVIDTPLIGALTSGTAVDFRLLDTTPILHRGGTVAG